MNDREQTWPHVILFALVLGLALLTPGYGHSQLPTHYTQMDMDATARACIHEATWLGASSADCGGMIQVIESRRRVGESYLGALTRTMRRFFGGVCSDNPWALHVTFSAEPGPNPRLWEAPYGYHAPRGTSGLSDAERAIAVHHRVQRYMTGELELPCAPRPVRWFGRRADSERLAEALDSLEWAEADCGDDPTANAFLVPVDVD